MQMVREMVDGVKRRREKNEVDSLLHRITENGRLSLKIPADLLKELGHRILRMAEGKSKGEVKKIIAKLQNEGYEFLGTVDEQSYYFRKPDSGRWDPNTEIINIIDGRGVRTGKFKAKLRDGGAFRLSCDGTLEQIGYKFSDKLLERLKKDIAPAEQESKTGLTKHERKELRELETRCLGPGGQPLEDASNDDLSRLNELYTKRGDA